MRYLLATAAYSNPELLQKCVDSWPNIGSLVFFDNLSEKSSVYENFHNPKGNLRNVYRFATGKHEGVAGSWNEILRNGWDSKVDSVIVVGSDTEMKEGFLEGFIKEYEEGSYDFAITREFDWNCWVMSKKCYETVGEFDINLSPCYYEDNDYHRRVKLSGLHWGRIGDPTLFSHYGSATIKLSAKASEANNTTFNMNGNYYVKKWGGTPGSEKYAHPYDDPTFTVKDWTLDGMAYRYKLGLWKDC